MNLSAIYACCECNYSQIAQEFMWLNSNHILPASIGKDLAIKPWPGSQSEQTRMLLSESTDVFCDEAESFEMEAWCCKWHPRVQKSNTGAPGLCCIAAMNSASMTPWLVTLFHHFHVRFHSVLIAFLLLRNRETVLVVNNASAHTAAIFNCC